MTHYLDITLGWGGLSTTFRCDAPEGADCRMWCDERCENWTEAHESHVLRDQGTCFTKEWWDIDQAAALEGYVGSERDSLVSGPINVLSACEDEFTWEYAETPDHMVGSDR